MEQNIQEHENVAVEAQDNPNFEEVGNPVLARSVTEVDDPQYNLNVQIQQGSLQAVPETSQDGAPTTEYNTDNTGGHDNLEGRLAHLQPLLQNQPLQVNTIQSVGSQEVYHSQTILMQSPPSPNNDSKSDDEIVDGESSAKKARRMKQTRQKKIVVNFIKTVTSLTGEAQIGLTCAQQKMPPLDKKKTIGVVPKIYKSCPIYLSFCILEIYKTRSLCQ